MPFFGGMLYCGSGSWSYLSAPPIQAGVSYDVVRGVNVGKKLFYNDPERAEGVCNRTQNGDTMLDSPSRGLDKKVKLPTGHSKSKSQSRSLFDHTFKYKARR